MLLFSYTAKDATGASVQGTMNAYSLDNARTKLRQQNLLPQEVFQISYDASPTTAVSNGEKEQIQIDPPSAQAPPHDWTEERTSPVEKQYYPIVDTLRLYAGWLLAWYALVYALGFYSTTRTLPFTIPYLSGIYDSPLVLSFTVGSFLFLLVTSMHRSLGRGFLKGLLLGVIGIATFVLYRVNV